jgi:hypothetical protein
MEVAAEDRKRHRLRKRAISYHNDEQKKLASETRGRIEAAQKIKVQTER